MGNQESKQHRKQQDLKLLVESPLDMTGSTRMGSLTDTTRSSSCETPSPLSSKNINHMAPALVNVNGLSTRSEVSASGSVLSKESRSSGTSTTVTAHPKASRLAQNLMRWQHRDPMEIYEPINVLGEGSMVSSFALYYSSTSTAQFC
jgi:hypothetical protein